ncbi:hypothetical protein Tco_1064621 [Tanacetum coccineum]
MSRNKKIILRAVLALITLLPPTTVIPDNVNVSARDRNQILQDAEHEEKETRNDSNLAANDMNEEEEINSPHSASSPHSVHSTHSDPPIFCRWIISGAYIYSGSFCSGIEFDDGLKSK